MKSLVTGGSGFIGSHIVDKLVSMGHDVTVIDNESANNEKFYYNNSAKYYKEDIRDYQKIRSLFDDVDYVFHLAAESRLQPAIENPIDAVDRNCVGTCVVLQCSREAKVKRLVYSSTSSGYGNNDYPNVETQPDDCLNPYSSSKIAAEKFCKMYSDLYELETICLRYFNVYGERAPKVGQYAPVIAIFYRQTSSGEPLSIVGDGLQRRDFIHVSDVVNANILASTKKIDAQYFGQVFNVGSGKNYTVKEIADKIDNENQIHLPERVGEVKVSLANIEKIKDVLGWQPQVDLMEWLSNR
jgi:UDP-glucose 4-epimerase